MVVHTYREQRRWQDLNEARYLGWLIKQIDHGDGCAPRHLRRLLLALWMLTVFFVTLVLQSGERLPVELTAWISWAIGVMIGVICYSRLAWRYWPTLRNHLSRDSIEARLRELEK